MKKTFYNIAELTEEFEVDVWKRDLPSGCDEKTAQHLTALQYQIRVNLAIAQQLSVISGHLGVIVQKSKGE